MFDLMRALALTLVLSSCSASNDRNDASVPAEGGSPGNCPWLADCVGNCASDEPCIDRCGAQATPEAVTQYTAILDCLLAASCADDACAKDRCPTQLAACNATVSPPSDGGAPGFTSSGKCEATSAVQGSPPMKWCWDYTLTADGVHNDGVEHYVYYDATSADGGKKTCTESAGTFTMPAQGALDAQAISSLNLQNKRKACELQNSPLGVTAVFSEGAACGLAGSLGHCTMQVANAYDAAAGTVTSTTQTSWSVP